ncbi:[FeFe] hydrogenase H-cluster maturation GTPase HydF [Eubacterium oxidoreducens]|uniref:[FeFe] hydrogenase H-cluster maturation GTPase HydF n=1 Tax=Eubacterium oxidoreducens TaxID=1732 RepID=A0A1G6BT31_EUBOX|nr:[FeFe] hydrogenase H-cluster maturation GTPase HydF [Eubacterium oxidoreducens]SDB23764.1 [FeFe] hydrogenase H-cluster maturation GTPase HydF [Eubacterium oxidoreducens]
MSLNQTPSSERVHISFFGKRNAGKSSLINAVTGQELAVVSDVAGTTTDPVRKAMELLPIGPVLMIDTPGFDDEGLIGEKRVQKTKQVLNMTDIALLVMDATQPADESDRQLVELFTAKSIPFLVVYTKSDLIRIKPKEEFAQEKGFLGSIVVCANTGENIYELKELIGKTLKESKQDKHLIADLISPGDVIVLVIPIDESAPKGRIILPQQQVLRDILETGAKAMVVRETELASALKELKEPPALVITDSQVFHYVNQIVPDNIMLTSFSILLARYKGFLDSALEGVRALDDLQDGDTVLISEGCTHHRQCEDIGTVKIPNWLNVYTGKKIRFKTTSGREFCEDLSEYKLVIHCGGCMLNEREMIYRMKTANDEGVPFTNYGILIAHVNGILKRAIQIFEK